MGVAWVGPGTPCLTRRPQTTVIYIFFCFSMVCSVMRFEYCSGLSIIGYIIATVNSEEPSLSFFFLLSAGIEKLYYIHKL